MLMEGKNAVVFAASGAIASAVARRFAAEGATTWLSARDDSTVQGIAGELSASGYRAYAERVDATDAKEIDAYLDDIAADAGGIDCVFNGIGGRPVDLGYPARSTEQTLENFLTPMRVIVGSQFLTARSAARHMPAGRGSIVLLSSGLAKSAAPHMAGISAASAAVEALARSLAAEFSPQGVRVNCVRGNVMPETRTIQQTGAALVEFGVTPAMAGPTLGRPLTVAETAAAVAFVASDVASGMTGQVLSL
jgi:NAD(P)-dependent dehydrogenase (short-subunit alcohol dehydrogenase family)